MAEGNVETMRFGSLDITFDADVLRPREWTTAQSRWAIEILLHAADGPVLELCTGAGQIGLLAVRQLPRTLVAVDVDPRAIEFARTNAERAGLADRVEFRTGELDEVLRDDEQFPVILADPPWVESDDVDDLPEDPGLAIDGGDDGLDIARLCLQVMEKHLAPGGTGIIQLGTPEQAAELARWARHRGLLTVGEVRTFERGVLARIDRF